jgi:hypothetical protein
MDFLTLEKSKGGYQHILVITDHYTRYAQAIPTKSQLAKPIVEDIFHIAQSRTLYLCTFLASKICLVAKIEFCLFLDVPYHHVGLVTLLVCVQQVRLVVVVPRLHQK